MSNRDGPTPVQPVPRPILCNPYEEPRDHWHYNPDTGAPKQMGVRRRAQYYYKTERVGSAQHRLFEEEADDLPLVNLLREDVARWREADYRGASQVTRDLLNHWRRPDRNRRLFFCQREAVETVIYLAEIRFPKRASVLRFKPRLSDEDLDRLCRGERPSFKATGGGGSGDWWPRLSDQPADPSLLGLRRLGCKMATGSGKTVVMAMLISWAFCNRGTNPLSREFPNAVLVCCPNLTIKDRLQVLRPGHEGNYYAQFDIVPVKYRDLLGKGRVVVENWHSLAPASPHKEGDQSFRVVDKGQEDAQAFAQRVLAELDGTERMPIMVLNDEGHHCWRPRPIEEVEGEESGEVAGEVDEEEAEEARVWLNGLDRINNCGALGKGVPAIGLCIDLSATPFYLKGSGHAEGSPFPWLVSDFGLVDAIESGIVKIPRLPTSDTTGRPDPKYFRLWHTITEELEPGEWMPGKRKPKPEVVYRKSEAALAQLAGQWKERFEYMQGATSGRENVPPVLIVVCDNTDIAKVFYEKISGERTEQIVTPEEAAEVFDEEEAPAPTRVKKAAKKQAKVIPGRGEVFPELLSNTAERKYTIRIDSKLLAEAERDTPGKNRSEAAEELRRVVSTVGKVGQPGEHVRCVVSVSMLTEGWDANTVTHILGVRAFGSQLLCEQVVGRGLRRIDYNPDPKTGMLTEEYVDVYGIPFSVIPFKGRPVGKKAEEDRPKNHVHAMEQRAEFEMRYPVVEGYVFALKRNLIRCDIDSMQVLRVEPMREPTATFMRITSGYGEGAAASKTSPFRVVVQDRSAYYRDNHVQTIKFEIAKHVMDRLLADTGGDTPNEKKARVLRLQARHQLFPQVFAYVEEYIRRKVDLSGASESEIALEQYARQIVEWLSDRIEPDQSQDEPPMLPVLNRTKPMGSTADVNFKTVRPCHATIKSHINQVVLDTHRWEASATAFLEASEHVECYARNEGMGFAIPYEHLGAGHAYEPDFIVRLTGGTTLVLEVKGLEDNQTRAKHEAAEKWVRAVSNWGRLGRWKFHVCRDPAWLTRELGTIRRE